MTINVDSGFGNDPQTAEGYEDDVTVTPTTVLQGLVSALEERVVLPRLTLPVPGRKDIEIEFDLDIDANLIPMWQKRAKDKALPDKLDVRKFATIVIADRTRAIKWSGNVVIDPDSGNRLTFTDKSVMAMFNSVTATAAVKAMYVLDASIVRTCRRIMEEAGYGEDVEWDEFDSNPTKQ